MDLALGSAVRRRAHGRCERGCQWQQAAAGGNRSCRLPLPTAYCHWLALACHRDNLAKGPNLAGLDPVTGKLVALFHPRRMKWSRHFRWDGAFLVGRTTIGRRHDCRATDESPGTDRVAADIDRRGHFSAAPLQVERIRAQVIDESSGSPPKASGRRRRCQWQRAAGSGRIACLLPLPAATGLPAPSVIYVAAAVLRRYAFPGLGFAFRPTHGVRP